MEMQCKERVDLLDALRKSRKEAQENKEVGEGISKDSLSRGRPPVPRKPENRYGQQASSSWLGDGTVPPVSYPDLSRPGPPLPQRPSIAKTESEAPSERSYSTSQLNTMAPPPPSPQPSLSVPQKKTSRTPSPEKKGRVMLTTLRGPRDKKPSKSPRGSSGRFAGAPPASSKAAGLAWDAIPKVAKPGLGQTLGATGRNGSSTTVDLIHRDGNGGNGPSRPESTNVTDGEDQALGGNALVRPKVRTPPDLFPSAEPLRPNSHTIAPPSYSSQLPNGNVGLRPGAVADLINIEPPTPPAQTDSAKDPASSKARPTSPIRPKAPDYPSYRTEFPPTTPSTRATAEFNARMRKQEDDRKATSLPTRQRSPQRKTRPPLPSGIARRPVANSSTPRAARHDSDGASKDNSESTDDYTSSGHEVLQKKKKPVRKGRDDVVPIDPELESPKNEKDAAKSPTSSSGTQERIKYIRKHLPKGTDEAAAKQIFNEIVVQGDEVHWGDVAGLEIAKKALKEAVVYPFLRPDLFMGLREPARGMLLFGPPGTGKTMLARAVATESRSTFFAISASSLTSKWLGESEKLVRALFSLAKALAPSIIFVDEIDSLLSSRGGSSEHESTRRIKTEFLIQWSDLQRAAAGSKQSDKDKAEGDASRVLVLAATNMPWAIDEAARRRFVRRQYIPLPEAPVRGEQLRTLLGHQKHNLNKKDIAVLVQLTDGRLSTPHKLWSTLRHIQAFRAATSQH